MNRIAFLYPWATMGGVERMLLNRAQILSAHGDNFSADFIFTHDAGGFPHLQTSLSKIKSPARALILSLDELENNYDLYICIDFPEAIAKCEQQGLAFAVECHTPYKENRHYLKNLSSNCKFVAAPSKTFCDEISLEIPKNIPLLTLENPMVDQSTTHSTNSYPRIWHKRPILFLGRHDDLKNPAEILNLLRLESNNLNSDYFAVFCGPQWREYDLVSRAEGLGVRGKVIAIPPIPFHSTPKLFGLVKASDGLFVSPSSGESFGLSAAEAISSGLPVMLSNIPAHNVLVSPYSEYFTYLVGSPEALLEKIEWIKSNYQLALNMTSFLRSKLLQSNFLQQWNDVIEYIPSRDIAI